jgi:hypothetical protein
VKKRCLNENFLLLDTLYAMSAFFAPDHIKVSIFIKFLIPPPQKMLKSAHDDFSRSAKFSVEYELYSLPKQDFRPILCFILMERS